MACWIASRDIPPRAIYADAIVEGMQACSACAVLVSAAANASKAVKRELELASHEDKAFIPIRIDGTEPAAGLAYYLRNTQWIEYRRDGEHALDRIVTHTVGGAPSATSGVSAEFTAQSLDSAGWLLKAPKKWAELTGLAALPLALPVLIAGLAVKAFSNEYMIRTDKGEELAVRASDVESIVNNNSLPCRVAFTQEGKIASNITTCEQSRSSAGAASETFS